MANALLAHFLNQQAQTPWPNYKKTGTGPFAKWEITAGPRLPDPPASDTVSTNMAKSFNDYAQDLGDFFFGTPPGPDYGFDPSGAYSRETWAGIQQGGPQGFDFANPAWDEYMATPMEVEPLWRTDLRRRQDAIDALRRKMLGLPADLGLQDPGPSLQQALNRNPPQAQTPEDLGPSLRPRRR